MIRYFVSLDENDMVEERLTAYGDYPEGFLKLVQVEDEETMLAIPIGAKLSGATWVASEKQIRLQRQEILETSVDPFTTNILKWNDLTTSEQEQLTNYRRQLLDITEQEGFPENVIWPTKP